MLAALEPAGIQSKAELERPPGPRGLRRVPRGKRLVRRLGIRYVLADPTHEEVSGRPVPRPASLESRCS
jgi:hypothetical protein